MLDQHQERQYEIIGNQLVLMVKRSPFFVRGFMFTFSFLFFLLPLVGLFGGLVMGMGLHIAYFMGMFVFGVLGFYLLRISLWNTFGKEIIQFREGRVEYVADYGWFKDGCKEKVMDESLEFSVRPIGFEDDHKGALIIGEGDSAVYCVTKMPNSELNELIKELRNCNTI